MFLEKLLKQNKKKLKGLTKHASLSVLCLTRHAFSAYLHQGTVFVDSKTKKE